MCKLEKEASVGEGQQGLEEEEKNYNQTCLVVGNSSRGNYSNICVIAWKVEKDHHPPLGFFHHYCVLWVFYWSYKMHANFHV